MTWTPAFRYEFKSNHEEWVKSVKPKLGPDVSDRILAAINTSRENMKTLYKVRTEMWASLQNLLKVSPTSYLNIVFPMYFTIKC